MQFRCKHLLLRIVYLIVKFKLSMRLISKEEKKHFNFLFVKKIALNVINLDIDNKSFYSHVIFSQKKQFAKKDSLYSLYVTEANIREFSIRDAIVSRKKAKSTCSFVNIMVARSFTN